MKTVRQQRVKTLKRRHAVKAAKAYAEAWRLCNEITRLRVQEDDLKRQMRGLVRQNDLVKKYLEAAMDEIRAQGASSEKLALAWVSYIGSRPMFMIEEGDNGE